MKLFILSKELYLKEKLIVKEYLKTCTDKKIAEDTIQGYLGRLCMESCCNMQVCHPKPNFWTIRYYDHETGVVTRKFNYYIHEVEI